MTRPALFVVLACSLACADSATEPPRFGEVRRLEMDAATARAPSNPGPKYKLRFITGVNTSVGDGEMQSGWFPDTGLTLNARTPWKSLVVQAATIDLVSSTHGRWTAGTCATFGSSVPINVTSWDIAGTSPALSFAGRWKGTVSVNQTTATSVSFDGDRVVDGVVTAAAGGIHNVVTNGNAAVETKDPTGNGDWFQLEIRDAAMKFGSASTPDGSTNPAGAEVACANFTILAMKAALIAP